MSLALESLSNDHALCLFISHFSLTKMREVVVLLFLLCKE